MKPSTLYPNHSDNLIDRYIPGRSEQLGQSSPHDYGGVEFAQPIEDEDIFNLGPQDSLGAKSPDLDELVDLPSPDEHESYGNTTHKDKEDDMAEDFFLNNEDDDIVSLNKLDSIRSYDRVDVDKLFVDDYSQSNDSQKLAAKRSTQDEQLENKEPEQTQSKQLTPSQIKRNQFLEKIRQQAQSMSLVPKKIGSDLNKDGMIDICIDDKQLISDSSSKFIFNSAFNRSKKANEGLDRGKMTWNQYKQTLQKNICAQKRKIWDSFQAPTDNYDEEEELIEDIPDSPKRKDDNQSDRLSASDVEFEDGEEELVGESEDEEEPVRRRNRISDDDDDEDGDELASNGNLEDLEKEDALILDEANHSWSDDDMKESDDDSVEKEKAADLDDDSDNLSDLADTSDESIVNDDSD